MANFSTAGFKTSDNLNLEVNYYYAGEDTNQLVLIVHGHGEHGGRFDVVADAFMQKGYNVAVLTLRGHGLSEGKRGHAPSKEQLLLDIEYFVRTVRLQFMEAKLYLYGHSMGANIVLNYLLKDKSKEITAGIATSPWLRLAFNPPAWKVKLGHVAANIFPTLTQPNGLDNNEISTIPSEVKAYREDVLIHDKVSAKLFQIIQQGGEKVIADAEKFSHPIYVAHGALDNITSAIASEEFAHKNKLFTWKLYPNSKHEIHHDVDFNELMEDMDQWLKNQS